MSKVKKPVTITFTVDEYYSVIAAANLQNQTLASLFGDAIATQANEDKIAFYRERLAFWNQLEAKIEAAHDKAARADVSQDGGWNCDDAEEASE